MALTEALPPSHHIDIGGYGSPPEPVIGPAIAGPVGGDDVELPRKTPVRPDRAGDVGERAVDQFGDQQALVIHRPGHLYPAFWNHLEAEAAVVGLVADQQHQTMAF